MRYKKYDLSKVREALHEYYTGDGYITDILKKYSLTKGVFYHFKRKLQSGGKIEDLITEKARALIEDDNEGNHFTTERTTPRRPKIRRKPVTEAVVGGSIADRFSSTSRIEPLPEVLVQKIDTIKAEPYEPKRSTSLKKSVVSEWVTKEKDKYRESQGGQQIRAKERSPAKPPGKKEPRRIRVKLDLDNLQKIK